MTPRERIDAGNAAAHALDLRGRPKKRDAEGAPLVFAVEPSPRVLLEALDAVRPIATAGTIGDAVRVLAAATTPRATRRALAELDALVTHAAHSRTKRAERANLVAQLVIVCGLGPTLGLAPTADLRAVRRRLTELAALR